MLFVFVFFFFQAEDGIRDDLVTGVQTCALPILAFPGVRVIHTEAVGSGHLRCTLADPLGEARLRAIAFRAAEIPLGRFLAETRSEERRVGKECRSRWSPYH